jgi:hypothetical protein
MTPSPASRRTNVPSGSTTRIVAAAVSASILLAASAAGADERAFGRAAASAALTTATAAIVAHCKDAEGPGGRARVEVTLAPTGNVKTVETTAPLAGTPRGACVITQMRHLTVEPYRGGDEIIGLDVTFR